MGSVEGGAADDGEGQQKGEAGGGFACHAEGEAGGHGDAGPGDSGGEGEGLGDSDGYSLKPTGLVDSARFAPAPFGEPEDDPKDDEEGGDDHRGLPEMGLYDVFAEDAGKGGGGGGDDEYPGEAAIGDPSDAVAKGREEGPCEPEDVGPEVQEEAGEGAGVHGEVEDGVPVGVGEEVPAEELADQDEMGGAADREELGEALDEAEEGRLDKVH